MKSDLIRPKHTYDLPSPITTLTPAQQAQVINLVRRAAQSEIMPRYQNLAHFEITSKSRDDDLVTQADLAAEAMITRGLLRLFPHAQVVGEEAVAKNPDLRHTMSDHEFTFVIDPIDGTWNYAKGIAVFGVILSVLRFGVPIFGVLYDPMMDDYVIADHATQSAQFVPARGAARPITTAPDKALGELDGYVHLGLMPKDEQFALAPVLPNFRRTTVLRCSCHEYRLVAQGHADFCLSATLNPWDHAAGVLACQMAGGVAKFLDQSPYDARQTTGYLLTASSQQTWDQIADLLRPVLQN